MLNKMFLPVFLASVVILSSCLHKDPVRSEADNVKRTMIFSYENKTFLLNQEIIYQATSKSYEYGVTKISGYEEQRLSLYDLETGELLKRYYLGKNTGKQTTLVLGFAGGKLWTLTKKNSLDLVAMDPRTFEICHTHEQIFAGKKDLQSGLIIPEWYKWEENYGFDAIENKIIITDNQGYRYAIDPVSLEISGPVESALHTFRKTCFNSHAYSGDTEFRLEGEIRRKLLCNSTDCLSVMQFIGGELLIDTDVERVWKSLKNQLDSLSAIKSDLNESLKKNAENGKSETTKTPTGELEYRLDDMNSKIGEVEREIAYTKKNSPLFFKPHLLSHGGYFFIAHRSHAGKDANLVITCLSDQPGMSPDIAWSIEKPGLFFSVYDARETNSFKIVFSKGNPSFDYQYFNIIDGKLVFIHMLHAGCIDISEGKLLWVTKL